MACCASDPRQLLPSNEAIMRNLMPYSEAYRHPVLSHGQGPYRLSMRLKKRASEEARSNRQPGLPVRQHLCGTGRKLRRLFCPETPEPAIQPRHPGQDQAAWTINARPSLRALRRGHRAHQGSRCDNRCARPSNRKSARRRSRSACPSHTAERRDRQTACCRSAKAPP